MRRVECAFRRVEGEADQAIGRRGTGLAVRLVGAAVGSVVPKRSQRLREEEMQRAQFYVFLLAPGQVSRWRIGEKSELALHDPPKQRSPRPARLLEAESWSRQPCC
jgi:hypothetical protein